MAKEIKKINLLIRLGILSTLLIIGTLLGILKRNEEMAYDTRKDVPLLDFDSTVVHADTGTGSGTGSGGTGGTGGTGGDGDGTGSGTGSGCSGDYHDGAP